MQLAGNAGSFFFLCGSESSAQHADFFERGAQSFIRKFALRNVLHRSLIPDEHPGLIATRPHVFGDPNKTAVLSAHQCLEAGHFLL